MSSFFEELFKGRDNESSEEDEKEGEANGELLYEIEGVRKCDFEVLLDAMDNAM